VTGCPVVVLIRSCNRYVLKVSNFNGGTFGAKLKFNLSRIIRGLDPLASIIEVHSVAILAIHQLNHITLRALKQWWCDIGNGDVDLTDGYITIVVESNILHNRILENIAGSTEILGLNLQTCYRSGVIHSRGFGEVHW